jgi:hypothetical protein
MKTPAWFTRKVIAWLGSLSAVAALVNTVAACLGWVRYPEHIPVSVGVCLAGAALCGWLYFVLPEKPDDEDGDRP